MKLQDLIEQLEALRDEANDSGIDANDIEVRLAHQPSWPFEHSIADVHLIDTAEEMDPDEIEETTPAFVVYIAESKQLGYLPGNVSRTIGWR